ncbi:MAG: hypothetical protein KDD45_16580 [Bdellovibrionales bacterium]|nr:hypothetical protein [Bdellovibrionales bacterium]
MLSIKDNSYQSISALEGNTVFVAQQNLHFVLIFGFAVMVMMMVMDGDAVLIAEQHFDFIFISVSVMMFFLV